MPRLLGWLLRVRGLGYVGGRATRPAYCRRMPQVWIGFVGMTGPDTGAARRFEDDVLSLLLRHGARVHFRGHRLPTEPAHVPAEFHVLWFPSEEAFANYLADPERAAIISRHGEVFDSKLVVRLEHIETGVGEAE